MALYAMSVSASVVSIRYCGAVQGKVIISALENNDCCCAAGHRMNMSQGQLQSDMVTTPADNSSTGFTGQTNAVASKSCCAEIVLQSRLAANQLINSETNSISDKAPLLLPATLPGQITYRPTFVSNHKPTVAAVKAPPSAIPLYKLFQRFTYYG